jgi:hypothetical protein
MSEQMKSPFVDLVQFLILFKKDSDKQCIWAMVKKTKMKTKEKVLSRIEELCIIFLSKIELNQTNWSDSIDSYISCFVIY